MQDNTPFKPILEEKDKPTLRTSQKMIFKVAAQSFDKGDIESSVYMYSKLLSSQNIKEHIKDKIQIVINASLKDNLKAKEDIATKKLEPKRRITDNAPINPTLQNTDRRKGFLGRRADDKKNVLENINSFLLDHIETEITPKEERGKVKKDDEFNKAREDFFVNQTKDSVIDNILKNLLEQIKLSKELSKEGLDNLIKMQAKKTSKTSKTSEGVGIGGDVTSYPEGAFSGSYDEAKEDKEDKGFAAGGFEEALFYDANGQSVIDDTLADALNKTLENTLNVKLYADEGIKDKLNSLEEKHKHLSNTMEKTLNDSVKAMSNLSQLTIEALKTKKASILDTDVLGEDDNIISFGADDRGSNKADKEGVEGTEAALEADEGEKGEKGEKGGEEAEEQAEEQEEEQEEEDVVKEMDDLRNAILNAKKKLKGDKALGSTGSDGIKGEEGINKGEGGEAVINRNEEGVGREMADNGDDYESGLYKAKEEVIKVETKPRGISRVSLGQAREEQSKLTKEIVKEVLEETNKEKVAQIEPQKHSIKSIKKEIKLTFDFSDMFNNKYYRRYQGMLNEAAYLVARHKLDEALEYYYVIRDQQIPKSFKMMLQTNIDDIENTIVETFHYSDTIVKVNEEGEVSKLKVIPDAKGALQETEEETRADSIISFNEDM